MFIILGVISFLTALSVMAQVDSGGDGIPDDGDNTGVVGDNPCWHYNTENCDDNCPEVFNPDQYDYNHDGIGEACCCELAGDANDDGVLNIFDITFWICIFYKMCTPDCFEQTDANNDGGFNILDTVYLINYLYKNGPPPVCGTMGY